MDAPSPTTGFDEFVDARYNRLVRTAYLLTRDNGLAEDLVQTALTKSWPKWRRIEQDPEAYVRRVMVNTYATWWRRRWRNEHPTEDLPDGADARHEQHVEDRTDLWRALGQLAPRQRAVIVLRFYEDQTETQTADILGCSVGTVKSQTSKALARLRIDDALGHGRTGISSVTSDGQGEGS
jgi:RNA polymerase sigma-70 factor (sigma-E family)